MATYTTRNRLIKQATNENKNIWGEQLNAGALDLIDFAMDGITSLALTGDVTLTTANGATDEARARTLLITTTTAADRIVTIPAVQKWYKVINRGANLVTIKTASGVGMIVPAGVAAEILCDGTDCTRLSQNAPGLFLTKSYTDFSSSNLDFSLTSYGCDHFSLVVKGYSANAAAGLVLRLSSDGVTWTATDPIAQVITSGSAGDAFYGGIEIPNTKAGAGVVTSGLVNLSANNMATSDQTDNLGVGRTPTQAATIGWRLSGGVKYLRLLATGGAPDAGTFELWGK